MKQLLALLLICGGSASASTPRWSAGRMLAGLLAPFFPQHAIFYGQNGATSGPSPLLAHSGYGTSGGGTYVTPSFNPGATATFIVGIVSRVNVSVSTCTVTDTNGNTFAFVVNSAGDTTLETGIFMAYQKGGGALDTTAGDVLTAVCAGYGEAEALSFKGAGGNPTDQSSGFSGSATSTCQAGSITPTTNAIVVAAASNANTTPAAWSINSGYSIADQSPNYGGSAYLGAAIGATNPTWTFTGAGHMACAIASFK